MDLEGTTVAGSCVLVFTCSAAISFRILSSVRFRDETGTISQALDGAQSEAGTEVEGVGDDIRNGNRFAYHEPCDDKRGLQAEEKGENVQTERVISLLFVICQPWLRLWLGPPCLCDGLAWPAKICGQRREWRKKVGWES